MLPNGKRAWVYDLLLIAVLAGGTWFRVIGLNWDENQHLHPDERFLTMVESALEVKKCADPSLPVQACPPDQVRWLGMADYFNTAASPLNPQNRGYGFFVYGDFPITVTRYVAEWVGQVGYDQVNLVGRQLSALGDLLTIFLLYIIAVRLYDRRVALLGAAFSALAVLQIQQSHFFTVDTVANLFIFLSIYFAVEVMSHRRAAGGDLESVPAADRDAPAGDETAQVLADSWGFLKSPLFLLSLGFGLSLGVAVASKLNAAPLAILLPGAFIIRYFTADHKGPDSEYWKLVMVCVIAGALASAVIFRIFMPYAFNGFGLNPAWVANIKELAAQSSGDADVPFALQWARRSHLFSFVNLTVWGLGLPLGILAWAGFLAMGWRILAGELRHLLLWGWTALYFGWQSLAFNPTMRYQLPIYPLLAMMAAWLIVYLWDRGRRFDGGPWRTAFRLLALSAGIVVLLLTLGWAYAFTRIYTRPVTRLAATRWIYQNVPGPVNLHIRTANGLVYQQPLPFPAGGSIQSGSPYVLPFTVNASGSFTEVYLPHAMTVGTAVPQTLGLSLTRQSDAPAGPSLAASSLTSDFAIGSDVRGDDYTLVLNHPVDVIMGQTYFLNLSTTGALTLVGAAPINETDWDDGLPLRLGLEGYDGYGGLYQGGLNLQIYWDDNADKLTRYVTTLNQGDYIFMSSNRQWASVTRVPERYPLTTAYYRALIGCPADRDVIWCYNVAKPGQFAGQLGYKLVAVFESYPTLDIPGLFHWEVNDQFAEEAFTVYDHPKVLIFQKTPAFNMAQVQSILGAVDLTHVVHLTPKQASSYRYKDLMLSGKVLGGQQAGGTWSQLFSYDWIQNKYPLVGLVIWYVFILILGVLTYPIVRLAFPGLGADGYPLARALGLVLLGYFSWLSGSAGLPVTRLTVAAVFAVLAAAGLGLGWARRQELAAEWRSRWKYFLMVEGLFLAFFAFDLLIRIGNPDLWHPAKGGERPMDFSYFNAVLKSTTFPPYDPWFAGGYINYYYYGFVLVAMPVKLLGIVPTIAYNFILPTLFATVAMGAFCVGWNLLEDDQRPIAWGRLVAGLLAASLIVVLGNLGTVRMVYQGLERMAAPGGAIDNANIFQRFVWAIEGFGRSIAGQPLPFGRGDWYWNPSRVIPPGPGNEITEFPFFTFLYSDLHAHMMAMPLALLALGWALSTVRARRTSLFSLFVAALVIGALYPTNLSDIYTYLPLGFAVLGYALWRGDLPLKWKFGLPDPLAKGALILASTAFLALASYALYLPYHLAYSQGYSSVDPWTASHTPIWSYLTHWGVFLFIITAWMVWETREWMASTPVSSLNKLRPYQILIEALLAIFAVGLLFLAYRRLEIGWVALPLAMWAGILLLRHGLADEKRFVLFLFGTSMLITILVELYAVRGDIGRMNTIFKFYLQAWALLSVSAGAALAWLLPELRKWLPGWRNFFQAGTALLLAGAALYTISATTDKVSDRMADGVPFTLDSITYMQYAQYADFGVVMDLNRDYRAIRWMQDHVPGSPVIVEANCPEYRWCTRFTIYTGLPGVVGWNWHQRQQRTLTPQLVEDRVDEIDSFYATADVQAARDFLGKYQVRYIIVGQLERAEYPGAGLDKFEQYNGKLWNSVYRDGDTVIYQVLP
jgi:YYY domain-containing protein